MVMLSWQWNIQDCAFEGSRKASHNSRCCHGEIASFFTKFIKRGRICHGNMCNVASFKAMLTTRKQKLHYHNFVVVSNCVLCFKSNQRSKVNVGGTELYSVNVVVMKLQV